ncbi:hypothetical protein Adt_06880 [Abeliophyllum distichum]|uniref:Uncharacterized protein n=1 Tax=Abeliophyllum distichum TaxID=126358 RepID=A0ABD1V863_9LAMI
MPQVDLETLVPPCGGGGNDKKIVCADEDLPKNEEIPDAGEDSVHVPPDYPPESFWLSKDAEYDWFDRNAFYERKESYKRQLQLHQLEPKYQPEFELQFSADSVGKTAASVTEPSSPKVSCMGRVRSKRGRRRSNSLKKNEKLAEKTRTGGKKHKTGFCSNLMSVVLCMKDHKNPGSRRVVVEEAVTAVEPQRKSMSVKLREIPVSVEPVSEPPGLGGVKRFTSGRRSGSWTAEDLNHAISESLYLDRRVGPTVGRLITDRG